MAAFLHRKIWEIRTLQIKQDPFIISIPSCPEGLLRWITKIFMERLKNSDGPMKFKTNSKRTARQIFNFAE